MNAVLAQPAVFRKPGKRGDLPDLLREGPWQVLECQALESSRLNTATLKKLDCAPSFIRSVTSGETAIREKSDDSCQPDGTMETRVSKGFGIMTSHLGFRGQILPRSMYQMAADLQKSGHGFDLLS